jgi:hypothetical protein
VKPDTRTAMGDLIRQVREAIPFDTPTDILCTGICHGCSVKLLEYLDLELTEWEYRLEEGEQPTFGDLDRLAKTSRKVYRVLQKNGLVTERIAH